MQIWKSNNIFVFISKQYVKDFALKHLFLYEICAHEICEKFIYKHSETIEYVKNFAYLLRNLQTLRVNNSRILRIKNAKFLGYCFYMGTNIKGDLQICMSVFLIFVLSCTCKNSMWLSNLDGSLWRALITSEMIHSRSNPSWLLLLLLQWGIS